MYSQNVHFTISPLTTKLTVILQLIRNVRVYYENRASIVVWKIVYPYSAANYRFYDTYDKRLAVTNSVVYSMSRETEDKRVP